MAANLGALAGRRVATTVSGQDEALKDHLVHEVPVLPGVFLLDLVLRLVQRAGIDPADVELRRCLFLAPVIDRNGSGRKVQAEIGEPLDNGGWRVTVRSKSADSDEWETNCQAEIHPGKEQARKIAVDALISSAKATVDVDELYGFVRSLDIHHRGFMKASGTVHIGDSYALARMRLPVEAQPYLGHFHVHPVVLDFSTLVPMWLFDPQQRAEADHPFIPIYIEAFRAFGRLGTENLVHVPRRTTGSLEAEIFEADIDVCASDGSLLASMTGFRAKRIRSSDLITRLMDTVEPPRLQAAVPAPSIGGTDLDELVAGLVAAKLGGVAADIDPDRGFYELGLDSVQLLAIAGVLEDELGTQLYPTLLFEHPTVRSLAAHLGKEGHAPQPPTTVHHVVPSSAPTSTVESTASPMDLAIVGLAGRYPGAANPGQLWELLRDGRDLVTEIPAERWDYRPYWSEDRGAAGRAYGKWGAFCDGIDEFDPAFFNLTERQAELMDPQERLFLQTAWEAIEDAGHTPERLVAQTAGAVGVFAGVMWNDYVLHGLDQVREGNPEIAGSWGSSLANRVSYTFDFQGPSLTVDTACSAALAALHLARESIRRGECRAALVGGVNLSLHPYKYLRLAELGLLSTDGRSRPFGKDADGYVPGEGVGAVLVRPLADALDAGDHVYAVIRGSAMQHSGRTGGFSVPSPDAQVRVVSAALSDAGVPPETITYLEAHASGTSLGDQIEAEALADAYGQRTAKRGYCAIGSVKTSIGHLEAAAGIAGLTKLLLCLRNKTIPGTSGVGELNPAIRFEDTPFYLPQANSTWPAPLDPDSGEQAPRRAGLSAFGAGGANVHVIVEEYDQPQDGAKVAGPYVVPLSARTEAQALATARRLADYLGDNSGVRLCDVAFTLQNGRRAVEHRIAVVGRDRDELIAALRDAASGRTQSARVHVGRVQRARTGGAAQSDELTHDELARAWVNGQFADWPVIPEARRTALPTYPFARERYWIGQPVRTQEASDDQQVLFYQPRWTPKAAHRDTQSRLSTILAFDTDDARVSALRAKCDRVIQVRAGGAYGRVSGDLYEVAPGDGSHLRKLVESLRHEGTDVTAVLHLWNLRLVERDLTDISALQGMFVLCQGFAVGRNEPLPVVFAYTAADESPALEAVAGLARSVRLEQPKLVAKVVQFTTDSPDAADLLAEAADTDDVEVKYSAQGRSVRGFVNVDQLPEPTALARDGGVYLISGGAGGLGRHTARRLAAQAHVSIALVGRSIGGSAVNALIAELESMGARAGYWSVDVTNLGQVEACVSEIVARFGPLTGVIHSAGVIQDSLLPNKNAGQIAQVLAPKVSGAVNLDVATSGFELDYFVLYSSTASVLGSVGATDYTAANRYLDSFAVWRERQRSGRTRYGRTVSINWPLWRDGGMRIDAAVEDLVLRKAGMDPLETSAGLRALGIALAQDGPQLVVLTGDRDRLEQRMQVVKATTESRDAEVQPSSVDLLTEATRYTTQLVRQILNGNGEGLGDDAIRGATFMELGMSSAQVVELGSKLERDLSVPMQPTLLFRHPDADRLAAYLVREHADVFADGLEPDRAGEGRQTQSSPTQPDAPIAIIGMAGRFPGSNDLAGFWDDLVAGRDLVSPVPADRWDHGLYHDPSGMRPGGTDCGHGGFVNDVARFDAEFFGVQKAEAEGMDPQLRLLLEVLYETAEHAAVTPTLRGSATGTFVGRCFQDYADEMAARNRTVGAYDVTGTAVVMAANRAAHYFDLTGPSLVVDTACSSSLYALHLAVQALRRGDCEMAFAAGVNLILSPQHYLRSSAIGALSPSGRCHSFDSRADGYVPSEAVAAVLLKPLDKAIADGDPIQAVIRGVAVNHGGHASSITAPNPERQTELLARAWTDAGIDPETLTYLEAHGTGTSLGDPIEVDAVTTAFRQFTHSTGFCVLGSAKAHMGHAEGAAGMVSVIKTALSMQHQLLPAMPTFQTLNPYCELENSPLWINKAPVSWDARGGVRRAGVSSFGFGGANAHAVLEEAPHTAVTQQSRRNLMFPISARTLDRLRKLVGRHRDFLAANPEVDLDRVAATLCRGREPMAERLVVVADSVASLIGHLDEFLGGDGERRLYGGAEAAEVDTALRWVVGGSTSLTAASAPRISMPGHPFAGERYWFDDLPTVLAPKDTAGNEPLAAELHRFVNESGFPGRRVAAGMDRLDDLIRRWCKHFFAPDGTTPTAGTLRGKLADPARYARMADALADLLTRAPHTTIAGGTERLAAELAGLVVDHPELKAWTDLVEVCLPKLPEILAGDLDALEVYFSPENPDLLFKVYSDSIIANHHNELVAKAVVGQVQAMCQARPGEPVRILEIGGGTGGTTRSVLAALAGENMSVHYTFTDVSPSFLPAARRNFGNAAAQMEFRVLDLDRDLEPQGFQAASADIVIAANAVHATKSIADSLSRIGRVLNGGGVLVLQELTRARDSITAMIGALPGYWAGVDPERRLPHSPLLNVELWRAALAEQGFTETLALGSADVPEQEFDNAVLVSVASADPRPNVATEPVRLHTPLPEPAVHVSTDVRGRLQEIFGQFFGLPLAEVVPDATFDKFGMDSLSSIQLGQTLEPEFGKLPKVLLYEYPTINDLAEYLAGKLPQPIPVVATEPDMPASDLVAIVGMAGKFAKSETLDEWWQHLRTGANLVTEIPADRFDWREVYGDPTRTRGTVNSRWGSFCDGVDQFDAPFFGVTPFEAELMDPQQRILLQTAWKAIEDAGHRPGELRGTRTGVFVGATSRDYDWLLQAAGRHREGHFVTGSGHCLIANRLSYQLDLRGPSEALDTACSSSLTALHRGVQSIRTGECDAAIVGGVHLFLTADLFVALGQLGVMSPDGRCATFDAKANGMVRGEGAVAVLLKPLSKALADGDTIHAVIRGSGVSHGGGRHASSLMMPEPAAQAELISSVWQSAGVDPRTVTYVEAHGTGTQIGDPVEIRGLRRAIAEMTGVSEDEAVAAWCGIGSVKSNVGHLESAAGLTGVVKTVMAMRHGMLPPSIHFNEPNPLLELDGSPFYVVDELRPWTSPQSPRRAAVSAFGLGGTNAHVLLEEYAQPAAVSAGTDHPEIVVLSARTPRSLGAYVRSLRDFLRSTVDSGPAAVSLADVAYTLRVGRDPMQHRLAVVASSVDELINSLDSHVNGIPAATVFTGIAGEASQAMTSLTDPVVRAREWVAGGPMWRGSAGVTLRRIPLPTYPFEPERHWVDLPAAVEKSPHTEEPDLQDLLRALSNGEVSVDEVDRILGGVS